ncbi:MAG: hypothetical protein NCW75_03000 [Phycisphaera sp.]|nr:MAG: hypothetical protein NCW75_03000 [Phycisphaera sp.]
MISRPTRAELRYLCIATSMLAALGVVVSVRDVVGRADWFKHYPVMAEFIAQELREQQSTAESGILPDPQLNLALTYWRPRFEDPPSPGGPGHVVLSVLILGTSLATLVAGFQPQKLQNDAEANSDEVA